MINFKHLMDNLFIQQPTLIDKGLGSDVSDVRAAALVVIMKISRSAGELLKPHLGVLIPALLVATGEMEGKELNYYRYLTCFCGLRCRVSFRICPKTNKTPVSFAFDVMFVY